MKDREYIIGIDEVGYGALAGAIYVCAFMAPKNWNLKGIQDSKVLSEKQRETAFTDLTNIDCSKERVSFCIVNAHPNSEEYKQYGDNAHGLLKYLYWKAASRLPIIKESTLIVLDGNIKFPVYPNMLCDSVSLPKADALIPQVSAASIIAKVTRDQYITDLGKKYGQYGWAENKGYPTKRHLKAIKEHGICDEHRRSYEPIKSIINGQYEISPIIQQ